MTELGGDAAIYFDPADPAAAAAIVADAMPRRNAIRAAGLENIRRFSVDNLIDGLLNAYRHVIGQRRRA
jgi:glycosyltransferase involved in cell wall biosynthesis